MAAFWELVERAAADHPDVVLLADDHGRALTSGEYRDVGERVAAGLWAAGVRPAHVVSWQLPTTIEAAVLMAAAARLGAVQNPLIPVLGDREVGLILNQVAATLFIGPVVWRGFPHSRVAEAMGVASLALELEGQPGPGLRLPLGDPALLPGPPTDDETARWVYYTSGTTSQPKGARHSDASVTAASNGMVDQMGIGPSDVYPIAWPFAHIGGVAMLAAVLRAGGRLVLFDTWDPVESPVRMAAHRPTLLGSATPFFRAYVAAQHRNGGERLYPSLRACVGGGAPTPQEVNREVAEVLGVAGVIGAWGLTEFPVATSETATDSAIGSTVGRPAAGVQVRVVEGELRLKGPQRLLGYVDSDLDADAFDDEGWFRTGDLGTVRPDGRVTIDGRLKDVIIRNAENISATEVEEVLLRHPSIADVAVIGAPDPLTGERVRACLVLEPGRTVDLEDLSEHCLAEGLARHKRPEQMAILDVIPRNSMGKVLKDVLRQSVL